MITQITGQLEIDHDRGVIYFHASTGKLKGATVLRICRLPKPIPMDKQLDVVATPILCDWRDTCGDNVMRTKEASQPDEPL